MEDAMEYDLNGQGLLDYVSTWSALQVAKKSDPTRDWLKEFRETYDIHCVTLLSSNWRAELSFQVADLGFPFPLRLESQGLNQVYHIVTPIYAVVAHRQ